MKLTRRQTLALGLGAGAAGLGLAHAATRGGGIAAHALKVVADVYGPEFTAQEAAHQFAAAYQDFVLAKGVPGRMVHLGLRYRLDRLPVVGPRFARIDDSIIDKFATSTNVILAAERGEPLVFVALFQPYEAPCQSQLAAQAMV